MRWLVGFETFAAQPTQPTKQRIVGSTWRTKKTLVFPLGNTKNVSRSRRWWNGPIDEQLSSTFTEQLSSSLTPSICLSIQSNKRKIVVISRSELLPCSFTYRVKQKSTLKKIGNDQWKTNGLLQGCYYNAIAACMLLDFPNVNTLFHSELPETISEFQVADNRGSRPYDDAGAGWKLSEHPYCN